MQPKSVTDILRKSEYDFPYLFFVFQVGNTGNAVTDRFDRGNKILMHDSGMVSAIGISPQRKTVHPQKPFQKQWVAPSNFSDRMDAVLRQLLGGGGTAIDHITAWERPDLLFV